MAAADDFPRPDQRGNYLALLLPGQQRVPGELGRLERSADPGNVRNIQEYYNILASPNADKQLPQVVFIERASSTGLDEHPENNVQTGAHVVSNIINALLTSAAWPDSAFILTYDEGGGLFDHVGPILVDAARRSDAAGLGTNDTKGLFNVTGFRVPVVVISPWVKPQTVISLADRLHVDSEADRDRFNVPPSRNAMRRHATWRIRRTASSTSARRTC